MVGWGLLKEALKPAPDIGFQFFEFDLYPRLYPRFGLDTPRRKAHLDQIDIATISPAGYALIGAGVLMALLFRRRKNRHRQAAKGRRDYHCLTATMPLGSDAGNGTPGTTHGKPSDERR